MKNEKFREQYESKINPNMNRLGKTVCSEIYDLSEGNDRIALALLTMHGFSCIKHAISIMRTLNFSEKDIHFLIDPAMIDLQQTLNLQ